MNSWHPSGRRAAFLECSSEHCTDDDAHPCCCCCCCLASCMQRKSSLSVTNAASKGTLCLHTNFTAFSFARQKKCWCKLELSWMRDVKFALLSRMTTAVCWHGEKTCGEIYDGRTHMREPHTFSGLVGWSLHNKRHGKT